MDKTDKHQFFKMNQKFFILVLIALIDATCTAWSQEEKFDSKTRSATSVIEDRISVRDTDQVKVTAKPLQVRVDEESESETKNPKKTRTATVQPVDNKDMLQNIFFIFKFT